MHRIVQIPKGKGGSGEQETAYYSRAQSVGSSGGRTEEEEDHLMSQHEGIVISVGPWAMLGRATGNSREGESSLELIPENHHQDMGQGWVMGHVAGRSEIM